jgi:hypothetical protein
MGTEGILKKGEIVSLYISFKFIRLVLIFATIIRLTA